MSTLSDVAARAGVSKMTVSRVNNNSGHVAAETRARVNEAIQFFNYQPNLSAKSLVTKRNNIIAYVTADIADPFYNVVVKGVENACTDRGFSSIICDAHSEPSVDSHINMLISRRIDGAIFHHLNISQAKLDRLNKAGVTCVLIDNEQDLGDAYFVESADYKGARLAMRYLLQAGHTRIACLHGVLRDKEMPAQPTYIDTYQRRLWQERTRGYDDAMREAGISYRRYFSGCGETQSSYAMAQRAVAAMLEGGDMPTAIYCESDAMARGALSEAMERDIAVPEKLAIVGHDGLDEAIRLYPRLTTVVQPRYDMGQITVNTLIDALHGKTPPRHITLEPSLFKGDTA